MAYTIEQKEDMFIKTLDYISNGMSLNSALKQDDTFSKTIWLELIEDEEKNTQYMRAREERADLIFEEMFDIADDGTNDYTKKLIGDGVEVEVLNSEHIQRSRLRIDTRKWALSKMNPKKYGDKVEVDNKSSDGSMSPKKTTISYKDIHGD